MGSILSKFIALLRVLNYFCSKPYSPNYRINLRRRKLGEITDYHSDEYEDDCFCDVALCILVDAPDVLTPSYVGQFLPFYSAQHPRRHLEKEITSYGAGK